VGFRLRFKKGTINLTIALLSSSALIVCLFSGVLLSFHYFYHHPLISVLQIETFVPFGSYLRKLHYFSAQVALIFLALHLIDALLKRLYLLKRPFPWFFLIFSLPLLLFLTFTGYLLRGDEVGELAGSIAENLLQSTPVVGSFLNNLFFATTQTGLIKVYHWHLIGSFFLAGGLLIWHIKARALFRWENLFYFLWLLLPVLIVNFPLNPFQGLKARGPWFFVGAQQMLKIFDPFLVFFFLLIPLPLLQGYVYFPKRACLLSTILSIYVMIYVLFSFSFFISPF